MAITGFVAAAMAGVRAAGNAPVTVRIRNFAFVPPKLTVPAGTTVAFINDDEEPHTVTVADKSFDSEALDTHQTWKHTFTKTGRTGYLCELQLVGSLLAWGEGRHNNHHAFPFSARHGLRLLTPVP